MRKKLLALLLSLLVLVSVMVSGCEVLGYNWDGKKSQSPTPSVTDTEASTEPSVSPSETATPSPSPSQTVEPSSSPSVYPSESAEPSVSPSMSDFKAETPDDAGDGNVKFDIYEKYALEDLNGDGVKDQITYKWTASKPMININGVDYPVKKGGLAKVFAITDINKKDKYLELVFTQKFDAGLADTEKPYSWVCYWDGTSLKQMGGLMDVAFDSKWRDDFKPQKYIAGKNYVMCLTNSNEFTDAWYMGKYVPQGSGRKLTEEAYTATPVNQMTSMTLLKDVLFLKKISTAYFKSSAKVLWDRASAPHATGKRLINPSAYPMISMLLLKGEKVTIDRVYGKNWFRLKSSDGHTGWIECVSKKMQGYNEDVSGLFDGIVVAG